MAEEHINPEDIQTAPVDTPESLGVDQASFDKYYKEGNFNWQGYSKELEFKMSQRAQAPEPQQPEPSQEPQADSAQAAVENAGLDWDTLSSKISETGELEDADYAALAESGIPEDIARNYVRMVQSDAESTVADVMAKFGGEDAFTQVYNGLVENASLDIRNQIDELLRNPVSREAGITMAWQYSGLQNPGSTPAAAPPPPAAPAPSRGNTGQAPASSGGYGSMEEMSLAMRDPRYSTDPVYRAEVERRAMGASFDFNPRRHTGGL